MALTLVSFKLCPFVQRSVIVLREKQVEFDIRYIDLRNKPDWFLDISPLGKVPLLQVGDAVLFESTAINEYLDETCPPALHPADPLIRAGNRAWIEIANQLSTAQFGFAMAKDEQGYEQNLKKIQPLLARLEQQLTDAPEPYFNGSAFALIDAAYAPFFTRQTMLEPWFDIGLLSEYSQVAAYGKRLLDRDSVANSIVSDYGQLYRQRLQRGQVWLDQATG